jgi:hypothetical protein
MASGKLGAVQLVVDGYGAIAVRKIGVVVALQALPCRPVVARGSRSLAALESTDRATMLEPMDDCGTDRLLAAVLVSLDLRR